MSSKRFDQGLFAKHQSDRGDSLGVISNALQLGCGLENGGQHAKISGHRLLGGDDGEGVVLDGVALFVDESIVIDETMRFGRVPLLERLDTFGHRSLGYRTRREYLILERAIRCFTEARKKA
jgi:hypothetical protein